MEFTVSVPVAVGLLIFQFHKGAIGVTYKIDGVSACLDGLAIVMFEEEEKVIRLRPLG